MAANARKTTSSYTSSTCVCIFIFHLDYIFIFFDSRSDLLFDKTSSSSADLHEPGDDSINNNFVLQSKVNSKQQSYPFGL
jgi:hypothetical protein